MNIVSVFPRRFITVLKQSIKGCIYHSTFPIRHSYAPLSPQTLSRPVPAPRRVTNLPGTIKSNFLAVSLWTACWALGSAAAPLHSAGNYELYTSQDKSVSGLTGHYYNGYMRDSPTPKEWRTSATPAGIRVDGEIDFSDDWGSRAATGITGGSGVNWDRFSVQWDGWIEVTHRIRLYLNSDDGSRMWVDRNGDGEFEDTEEEFINHKYGSPQGSTDSIHLPWIDPGLYRIRIQYEEIAGGAVMQLKSFNGSVSYTTFQGDTLQRHVWEGRNVAILTASSNLDQATMAELLKGVDAGYDYYAKSTAYTPIGGKVFNGKLVIAQVSKTCGAGCGYLGANGVEIQDNLWTDIYRDVHERREFHHLIFYEIGRNFWNYSDQIDFRPPDLVGVPTTGFAILMRYLSIQAAELNGAPFRAWDYANFNSAMESLIEHYENETSLNFANTFANGAGLQGTSLGGVHDLWASMVLKLRRLFGGEEFMDRLWLAVKQRPYASTTAQAVDNFVYAASVAAQLNLSRVFEEQWRFPVSNSIKASIQVVLGDPVGPSLGKIDVFNSGANWKYYGEGAALPSGWRQVSFNDKSWKSGLSPLGYGTAVTTNVTDGHSPGDGRAFYFRKTFDVADPSLYDVLTLRLKRDDGVVVYLNGVEVGRENMPRGPVQHTTPSWYYAGANFTQWWPFQLPVSQLKAGKNVLAVEVHGYTQFDPALIFDAEMFLPVVPPKIVTQPLSLTVPLGKTATFSVIAAGSPLLYQWRKNGVLIPGKRSATFKIPNVGLGDVATYDVMVSNSSGEVISEPASLAIGRPGSLAFDSAYFVVKEDEGSMLVKIERTGGTDGVVALRVSTADATARSGHDYTGLSDHPVVFESGQALAVLPISIFPTAGADANRHFSLKLKDAQGGAGFGARVAAMAVIIDTMDSSPPKNPMIKKPLAGQLIAVHPDGAVRIEGSASDTQQIGEVLASIDGGLSYHPAALTLTGKGNKHGATANFAIDLVPGAGGINSIRVKAVDRAGNASGISERFFDVLRPLLVTAPDPARGKVSAGYAPSSFRQIGKVYTLLAKPRADYLFDHWEANNFTGTEVAGDAVLNPELKFRMVEGLELTPHFIASPFIAAQGRFAGLVLPTADSNDTSGASHGLFSAAVSSSGVVSGSIKWKGSNTKFSGRFDSEGTCRFGKSWSPAWNAKVRGDAISISLSMPLGLEPGEPVTMRGLVSITTGLSGAITCDIHARRAGFSKTHLLPAAYTPQGSGVAANGVYTAVFRSIPQSVTINGTQELADGDYPSGSGWAKINLSATGKIRLSGKLADHTAVVAGAEVLDGLRWPLFCQLYKGGGAFGGWVELDAGKPDSDLRQGECFWIRPANSKDRFYPAGWPGGIRVALAGSIFTSTQGVSMLTGSSAAVPEFGATLSLSGAGLAEPLTRYFRALPTDRLASVYSPVGLSIEVDRKSGAVSGRLKDDSGASLNYSGVILQKGGLASEGYFQPTHFSAMPAVKAGGLLLIEPEAEN